MRISYKGTDDDGCTSSTVVTRRDTRPEGVYFSLDRKYDIHANWARTPSTSVGIPVLPRDHHRTRGDVQRVGKSIVNWRQDACGGRDTAKCVHTRCVTICTASGSHHHGFFPDAHRGRQNRTNLVQKGIAVQEGVRSKVIFSPIPARASRAWAAETRGRTRPTGLARAHRVRDGRWLGGGGKRVRTAGRRQRLCAR